MKKTGLLNVAISSAVAQLGHGNSLCISDAGLPVAKGVSMIDLAVSSGVPSFIDVLNATISEMYVERVVIAAELEESQPQIYAKLQDVIRGLEASQNNSIKLETIPHVEFKTKTQDCLAVMRTGECTPFANVILYAGVPF